MGATNTASLPLDLSECISTEIEKDPNAAYFSSTKVKRFGWNECYLVQIDEHWYYVDIDGDNRRKFPGFIKTRADAEAFILEANLWYVDGQTAGVRQAKNELRQWLQSDS